MHLLKLLLAPALCLLLFVSCSKHEDAHPSGSMIAGSWKVTVISYAGTSTTHVGDEDVTAQFTGEGKNLDMILTFSQDPDVYVANGNYNIVLKTTINGQDYQSEFSDPTFAGGGTWSEEDGKFVTVTNEAGHTGKARFYRVAPKMITMSFDQTSTEMENGIPVQLNMHGVYVLER